jgi:flavin reductase (DIM6/NTAB) family NADH-FMN oxidoreductase RutF
VYIELDKIKPVHAYFHMTQTLIPRPIAWVLSENKTGTYNLAPFSYFSAISSSPPLIMISIGKKPDGSNKDTKVNIEKRNEFVVHIAHKELLEHLNQSSETLPAETSELETLDIEITDFAKFRLPRIKQCRVAYACELYQLHEIGDTPQTIIYGKVNSIYIDDTITSTDKNGHIKAHANKLDPIARLGANEYMEFGNLVQLNRPK